MLIMCNSAELGRQPNSRATAEPTAWIGCSHYIPNCIISSPNSNTIWHFLAGGLHSHRTWQSQACSDSKSCSPRKGHFKEQRPYQGAFHKAEDYTRTELLLQAVSQNSHHTAEQLLEETARQPANPATGTAYTSCYNNFLRQQEALQVHVDIQIMEMGLPGPPYTKKKKDTEHRKKSHLVENQSRTLDITIVLPAAPGGHHVSSTNVPARGAMTGL